MLGVSIGDLLWRLHRFIAGERTAGVQYECRQCGKTIHKARQYCPACGAGEVARYEL